MQCKRLSFFFFLFFLSFFPELFLREDDLALLFDFLITGATGCKFHTPSSKTPRQINRS